MEKKYFTIGGFQFDNEAAAEKAKKELSGIQYIKDKLDLHNDEMVLNIYNQILEQKMFETQVGMCFLKEMQDYLLGKDNLDQERIVSIPITSLDRNENCIERVEEQRDSPIPTKAKNNKSSSKNSIEKKYKFVKGTCFFLIIALIGMFIIAGTSNSVTILNYEKEILDRYASWEQDLTEREANIKKTNRENMEKK